MPPGDQKVFILGLNPNKQIYLSPYKMPNACRLDTRRPLLKNKTNRYFCKRDLTGLFEPHQSLPGCTTGVCFVRGQHCKIYPPTPWHKQIYILNHARICSQEKTLRSCWEVCVKWFRNKTGALTHPEIQGFIWLLSWSIMVVHAFWCVVDI